MPLWKPDRRTLLAALLSLSAGAARAATFDARLVDASDGDTLSVMRGDERVRVRLGGIDAPEMSQPYGRAARDGLRALAGTGPLRVRRLDEDRFGRIVAVVSAGPVELNREMVRLGLAWAYRRRANGRALADVEAEARAARRGLWADPDPVAPWQHRALRRGGG